MMHETIAQAAQGLRLTVEAKPLADALDYLARFVALKYSANSNYGRSDMPRALASVVIEADRSGLVLLSSCDLDMQCVVTVQGAVDAPGAMAVNAATLRDLVKSARADARISLHGTDIGRAVISHGRIKQTIAADSLRNMPGIRPAIGNALELDAATLAIDIKRLQPFVIDHERRSGAMLVRHAGGMLELIAGDGSNLSVAVREAPDGEAWESSFSPRAVEALARALKAWPGATVEIMNGGDVMTIVADRFAMTFRAGDAAGWGDWRAQAANALGAELQQSFMPDDEPRLQPDAMKRFAKAAGAMIVEIGDRAARLSIAGNSSWQGVTMLQPEGTVPSGYSYGGGNTATARAYLVDLMERHGIDPVPGEQRVIERNGRVLGMTVGEYHGTRRVRHETVIDWEALVERDIEIVEHEAGWQPGSFSVVMPRVREAVSAEMAVDVDGELIPLATNARGSIYMTAAQVAKWCGPVDPSTHVAIAPLPMAKAWWKKAAPLLAPKPIANALQASAADMAAYASACQAAADLHNGRAMEAPAVAIDETPPPVAIAESVALESVAATVPMGPGQDYRDFCAAQAPTDDERRYREGLARSLAHPDSYSVERSKPLLYADGSETGIRWQDVSNNRRLYVQTDGVAYQLERNDVEAVRIIKGPNAAANMRADDVSAPAPVHAMPADDNAALVDRVAKLESLVDALQALALGNSAAPILAPDHGNDAPAPLPADPRARAVATARDTCAVEMVDHARAKRLRIVRRYLAMRRDRAALRALQVQHAIGQAQYDDVKARLTTTEQALDDATARIEQGRADARRYASTEQALIDARARGDRLVRVAMRQRTGLARAAIDLRGARAETGAVRRQLTQALQPAPAPVMPVSTLAGALSRAGL